MLLVSVSGIWQYRRFRLSLNHAHSRVCKHWQQLPAELAVIELGPCGFGCMRMVILQMFFGAMPSAIKLATVFNWGLTCCHCRTMFLVLP